MMNKRMEEVLVLRKKVRCPWLKIVGTDQSVDGGIFRERGHSPGHRGLMQADVGIDEQQNIAQGRARTEIASVGRPAADRRLDHSGAGAAGDFRRTVRRAVVRPRCIRTMSPSFETRSPDTPPECSRHCKSG